MKLTLKNQCNHLKNKILWHLSENFLTHSRTNVIFFPLKCFVVIIITKLLVFLNEIKLKLSSNIFSFLEIGWGNACFLYWYSTSINFLSQEDKNRMKYQYANKLEKIIVYNAVELLFMIYHVKNINVM